MVKIVLFVISALLSSGCARSVHIPDHIRDHPYYSKDMMAGDLGRAEAVVHASVENTILQNLAEGVGYSTFLARCQVHRSFKGPIQPGQRIDVTITWETENANKDFHTKLRGEHVFFLTRFRNGWAPFAENSTRDAHAEVLNRLDEVVSDS